ncbi:unnamed protein product [Allacma fusca]|uniref:WD repeat-containing protein 92 n=2 Tax=Allacma fusca TaxID=39272 RepID=A0A8J2KYE0_9HEXA|nr:unnamed protein product [Allacma fusca]
MDALLKLARINTEYQLLGPKILANKQDRSNLQTTRMDLLVWKQPQMETMNSMKCGSFGAAAFAKKHLAIGDFKGNLQVWDIESAQKSYDVKAHSEIINALDAIGGVGCGAPEIATASRDGSVKIWDVRQKEKPVAVIEPGEGEDRRDCWAVSFGNSYNNEERVVCSGYDNGDVKMFDLRVMKLLWEKNLKNGVCSIEFDRKDIPMNKLLVTTLESTFHVIDCRTLHKTKGFACLTEKAHKSTIWMGRHLPQNRDLFMTTGGAGSLCLWKYNYPDLRVKQDTKGESYGVAGTVDLLQNTTISTQPLSAFDWCPEKQGLAICTSFDQTLRLIIVTKLNTF